MTSNSEMQTFAEKKFGISLSTFQFFLLCIATMNFYYYHWMIKFFNVVCDKKDTNRFLYSTFIAAGLFGWSLMIPLLVDDTIYYSTSKNIDMLINMMSISSSAICVYSSFKLKDNLEKKMLEYGIKLEISSLYSIIFPFIYQYYIIINAELLYQKKISFTKKSENADSSQRSNATYEELEKLSKLKDSGVITEDEFSVQKKKILGESN